MMKFLKKMSANQRRNFLAGSRIVCFFLAAVFSFVIIRRAENLPAEPDETDIMAAGLNVFVQYFVMFPYQIGGVTVYFPGAWIFALVFCWIFLNDKDLRAGEQTGDRVLMVCKTIMYTVFSIYVVGCSAYLYAHTLLMGDAYCRNQFLMKIHNDMDMHVSPAAYGILSRYFCSFSIGSVGSAQITFPGILSGGYVIAVIICIARRYKSGFWAGKERQAMAEEHPGNP